MGDHGAPSRTSATADATTADGATADDPPTRRRRDPRRARTRRRLLDAGREVFERDGFHLAKLSDVTKGAGVSTGAFYHHFGSKEELFRALVDEVIDELTEIDETVRAGPRDPVVGILEANRAYIKGYRRNARLMTLLVQLDTGDEIVEKAREMRSRFEQRLVRAITAWQEQGLAYVDLDPLYAANALAYMVDRFLYEWAVLDLPYDEEEAAEQLTKLWARGLGLEDGPRRSST
ncbi:MAG: TetR/AcrR family transcriptional regulator [Actinomycetota bacterium]|nr:TetR/AcrR family transcriptional regulator [Actinomycetota bacterium]